MIEYLAIGALVSVALIIGITRFKKSDKNDEVFSRKEFKEKWKEVEILEANVPKKEDVVSYNIEDGKIPFKGPFDEKVEAGSEEIVLLPDMQFQGMVWRSSRPQAIINNKVYDVKDIINTAGGPVEIKEIKKDGIHLLYMGKEFIVRPK